MSGYANLIQQPGHMPASNGSGYENFTGRMSAVYHLSSASQRSRLGHTTGMRFKTVSSLKISEFYPPVMVFSACYFLVA